MGCVLIYGTFDLFHLGHKNILDGAKRIAHERNLELVVGVTSKEFDIQRGKTNVHDSIDVRTNNVKKWCNPNDIITESYVGQKIDDIKKYDAKVIVFGSDWEGKMDYLNEYCEVIYLPRTEGISSTMLRAEKEKKNAVVIGGTSDIGMSIIDMLLKRGYDIISTYYSTIPTRESTSLIWIKYDASSLNNINGLVNKICSMTDKIDVFIYNSGCTCRKPATEISEIDVYNTFNTNVFSCLMLINSLREHFTNNAKIIVTSSQMGIHPHSMSLLYGMSKECLNSMVKNYVKELNGTKMTINAVIPGFVETKWQKDKPKEIRENICKKTALHRFADVEEIVKGFEFCLENDFVNGSLLEINGGYCYK